MLRVCYALSIKISITNERSLMKSDLDRLMAERNLDGLLVLGDAQGNTVMNYLTNGVHLERALVLKRRDGPMTLVHGGMERDNAATTGLVLVDRDATYNQWNICANARATDCWPMSTTWRMCCATRD